MIKFVKNSLKLIFPLFLKVPYLIPDASDSASCVKVGYSFDGFPVHGQCADVDGNEMISCYKLIGNIIYYIIVFI